MPTTHKKQIKTFILALIILFGSALGIWANFLYSSLISDDQGYKYTVKPGTAIHTVIDDLTHADIIKHPLFFKYLVYLKGNSHELKSGEYLFPKGTNSLQLLKQITTGSGVIYHTFTIIPGWNFKQVRAAILQNPDLDHSSRNLTDDAIMAQLGEPNTNPEGEFYPDTYYFIEGSSDITLLKRAHHSMQEKLKNTWNHRDPNLPYQTPYEALIVASLIEKEAQQNMERPIIAGVIVNRLNKGMLLQIDPTVIYGMGTRYNGVIHKTDLIENTPYNTYVHKGLTPTPIAMPGEDSIQAAMHPKKHDFYYFVVRGTGESTHQFTSTLEDHYKAVSESKKFRPDFFNNDLIRYYLSKIVLPMQLT